MPEAELVTDEASSDATGIINPPANACPTCGLEVVREPGKRGRVPKYHPECRPVRGNRASVSGGPRLVRVGKAEEIAAQQTELLIEQLRRGIAKAVALISLVDPYDALVLQVNAPEIIENTRPVLMQFEWLRKGATNVSTGGSIFGLIVSLITTALPILAHHGKIPNARASQILVNLPFFLMRIQAAIASGNEGDMTEELVARVREQATREREAAERERSRNEAPVNRVNNNYAPEGT